MTDVRLIDPAPNLFFDVSENHNGGTVSDSAFRYRGLKVVVDTTEKAEFDIKGYQIPDATMEAIARQLRDVSFSRRDRVVGDARVREIDNYDIVFIIGREDDTMVITIGAMILPDPVNPTEELLKKLGPIAIFRGALGP